MKSYTDLEQSKKLAEILPGESADMEYLLEQWIDEKTYRHKEEYYEIPVVKVDDDDDCSLQPITLPCWSLAALLDQLEDMIYDEEGNQWELVLKKENVQYDIYYLNICGEQDNIELDRFYNDLIDCCYEMIIKLKEKDLL